MTRDPRNYKDPNKFDPLRFLGDNPERDPLDFVFGFGRRICPGMFRWLVSKDIILNMLTSIALYSGRFFADHNLYLAITSTLTVFDILKAIDERGAMIEPTLEYKNFSLR
jgi:fumagillin biosynthesis cytochrome P450 monooxygenase